MFLLRLYLLAGLVAHKAVWEALKRRPGASSTPPHPHRGFRFLLVKAVKLAILGGIAVQTCLPDLLPISANPLGLRIAGAVLYTAGLLTAILARIQLGANWSDIEAAQVRPAHAVVATGIYRYVRHPIYAGDLALLFGLELALNSWFILGVLALTPFVLRQAIREERQLLASLAGYDLYCSRTRRFLPFLW